MAETLQFELVSPERLLVSEPVAMVVVPGSEGDFGVLPRHAPLIANVRPGVITVYETRAQASRRIFVAGGFAEVVGERCTVLVEEATPLEELDRASVEQALQDAREDVADAKDDAERAEANKRIKIAEEQLRALSH